MNKVKEVYKKILVFAIVAAGPITGFAQQPSQMHLVDHKPLMNKVWETFDLLMYRVTKKNGKTTYTPHFPPPLANLNGKTVTISGYMIPFNPGKRHNVFLLSVLPIHQCMFCGQDGIPAMTEITMTHSKKILISETPVRIRGVVLLNDKDKTRTEIQLKNAVILN